MKISSARVAAFDILLRIETERAFSSVLLPLYEEKLSPADRSLCHQLTLGVLRRQIYLDKLIEKFTNAKRLDVEVVTALRLGLFQLKFLDKIPDYSITNESVNLVLRAKKSSAKGLVNAVLRRAAREKADIVFTDEIDRISIETSHPRWLVEKWIGQFGIEETETLAKANNEIPCAAFRVTARGMQNAVRIAARESRYVEGCLIAENVDSELRRLAASGDIYFQDEASQMVAAAIDLGPEDRLLDVCAAPGSKTTMIAARSLIGHVTTTPASTTPSAEAAATPPQTRRGTKFHPFFGTRGVLVVAGDIYDSRVRFLRENCIRQGVENVEVVQYDAAASLPFADKTFDVVLVDAPCSGTGTIRHNPEIRYFLDPSDFEALQNKQLAILNNASKVVRAGGKLIYSTCSLEIEENEAVAVAFLENNGDFAKAPVNVPKQSRTIDGFARTFPHRDGMDGFFVAEFAKRA